MTVGEVFDEFVEDADRIFAAVFVFAHGDRTEFGLGDEAHEAVGVADDFNLVKRHQGVERAFVLDGEIVRAALAVPIRSDERRVGKACVSRWRYRWSPYP